jgi:hypothetical protein
MEKVKAKVLPIKAKPKLKKYIVSIVQYCEPIIVEAYNEQEAETRAVQDEAWEPSEIGVSVREAQ